MSVTVTVLLVSPAKARVYAASPLALPTAVCAAAASHVAVAVLVPA